MSQRTLHHTSRRAERHDVGDRMGAVRSIVRMGVDDGNPDAAATALMALGVTPEEISAAEHTNGADATPDWAW